jgi:hypothetical protein
LMFYVLGVWKLAVDMGLTSEFGLSGMFAHWQFSMGLGAVLHLGAFALNRYGISGELHWPGIFHLSLGHPAEAEEPVKARSASAGK